MLSNENNKQNITRKELTHFIYKKYYGKVTLQQAKTFIDEFFNSISDALLDNETIKLPCFGTFSTVQKVARPGRNPRTGIPVEITARRVVRFRPSRKLRQSNL